jgi:hypothetical protein
MCTISAVVLSWQKMTSESVIIGTMRNAIIFGCELPDLRLNA